MDFGEVLVGLKAGKAYCRKGWNAGEFIRLQVPDALSKMKKPYIYISPIDGEFVPWVASQTDMLAEDWLEVFGVPEA